MTKHQIIESPVGKHSKKPNIVSDKIVELCGELSDNLITLDPEISKIVNNNFWDLI